uniref:Small-subunit processome Utp21 domain-containing protein n=1 Tax=Meloidogyne incognita TaxID=6306 RepID=A0A914ME02_MELIC
MALRGETNLFTPCQAIGLFCSKVPPAFTYSTPNAEDTDGNIACAIENQCVFYSSKNLHFTSVCPPVDTEITAVAADMERTYVAFGFCVAIISNNFSKIERRLIIGNGGPKMLLSLTDILVVVDKGNTINVYNTEDGHLIVQLESSPSFNITSILHPDNYLNKILVGSSDARMRIWNLRSGKLIYEFDSLGDDTTAINVLEQSPVIDVVGIGMSNGKIILKNIKFDTFICSFRQTGTITALAFRSDGVDTLASANSEGSIAIWDLNERILIGQLTQAHQSSITWLNFLLGQAYLLSAGEDNKIVKWVFRNENSLPEVQNCLQGHSEPATTLKFFDDDLIVSASKDGHVRQFDSVRTVLCKDFGLAREVRKGDIGKDRFIDVTLEPILQMELSFGREAVWDNAVCRHSNSPLVSTWSTRLKKRGRHLLYHERFSTDPNLLNSFASSICISNCGNFVLIGYSSGHVDVFNMQSGKYKFSLESKKFLEEEKSKTTQNNNNNNKNTRAHDSLVAGIALDILNRNVVTGSADGKIYFWKFGNPSILRSIMKVASGVQLFRLDLLNSLLAVGLANGEVGIVDILCRKLARRFSHSSCTDWPEGSTLTALEFSSDGKWLLSADNQGFVKVWDLSSGLLIDVVYHSNPCIAMAFNPRGNLLATCHEGQRGIYLWANKLLYSSATRICVEERNNKLLEEDIPVTSQSLPSIQQKGKFLDEVVEEEREISSIYSSQEERVVMIDEEEDEDEEVGEEGTSGDWATCSGGGVGGGSSHLQQPKFLSLLEHRRARQLDPKLFTLSGQPTSSWASLPIYELIKERNKPKEPPKKAKELPFFLPTIETEKGVVFSEELFNKKEEEENEEKKNGKRTMLIAKRQLEEFQTEWGAKLLRAGSNNDLLHVFDQLKTQSLASIDFQIRALNGAKLGQFVSMLIAVLEIRKDFDLIQSYMAAFLNIHRENLWKGRKGGGRRKKGEDEENLSVDEKLEKDEEQNVLLKNLQRLLELQKIVVKEIQPIFDQNISITSFTKSALI